jgi:hypothetical protein
MLPGHLPHPRGGEPAPQAILGGKVGFSVPKKRFWDPNSPPEPPQWSPFLPLVHATGALPHPRGVGSTIPGEGVGAAGPAGGPMGRVASQVLFPLSIMQHGSLLTSPDSPCLYRQDREAHSAAVGRADVLEQPATAGDGPHSFCRVTCAAGHRPVRQVPSAEAVL